MIRRFTALALGALLLHLNVERADLACATHSHNASAQAHVDHATTGHHDSMAGSEHSAALGDESCQTPSQPDCCQALASCSVMLSPSSGSQIESASLTQGDAIALGESHPHSRNTAPEPPPPRA